ncbi:MAG: SGNH/GDSL hydrolase family protein [Planctomycetota bacterium]|nr:SGNH/GDSL hydrolase family protein [Planctomycetota bacterium]MDA1177349.1 SGNH/GDSL hydrolase family protein [Planctomycetota bacterium]
MLSRSAVLVLIGLTLAIASPLAIAAPLHIVTVGDLHTQFYSGSALHTSFRSIGVETTVVSIPSEASTSTESTSTSLSARILAERPDVVVLMIGTPDAKLDQFEAFTSATKELLDDVDDYAAGRTQLTQLLIVGNISILNDPATSDRLSLLYNPWLRRQSLQRDWLYVDMEARLVNIARWQQLFADGEMLTPTGYDWMTVTIRNQIMELPFPDPRLIPEPQPTGPMLVAWLVAMVGGHRPRRVISSH